ncbi:hypothetical protein [Nitratireductor sp. ZSWI3]|uniref:hypothetical protein n=1 Tax=Nitratireductor sp. ZSWI3 TaxID=2966359 RepID=UPI00214FEA1D|nr:hypothetical protein [Nitratireductor sp. ZSWI3]MCR4267570.1 hypothetical protein [Nitratireductor sp. ZSWI3]
MNRTDPLLPLCDLPSGAELLAEGAAAAKAWYVGPSAFLSHVGADCEHDFKLGRMAERKVMQHAQIGYRDLDKSCRAYAEIWEICDKRRVTVDRYGLCLDWSMGVLREKRSDATRGTGMILEGPEDFVRLANAAPVAPHFGDFVLGFGAAFENTKAALAAGCTAVGNLGQYFTFRIPGHDDDIEATQQTVRALGLIAAQPVPVMVHSNIDDGYAAQFTDLASCLGMILIERDIIGRLVGAPIGHCYGHHFSDPFARLSFQRAMAMAGAAPGTVIYGNTTSYRGTPAENYSGLASYLLTDALGQMTSPTGHAINAVPVTENQRIPEIDEVIDAQLFAASLIRHAEGFPPLVDKAAVERMASELLAGARRFQANLIGGLTERGVNTDCVFQMLLSLRRLGARAIERDYGAGPADERVAGGRAPLFPASLLKELSEMSAEALKEIPAEQLERIRKARPRILVATSDVHEHGKMLIDRIAVDIDAVPLDGGVSTEPERLAALAAELRPDIIAISTYNGIALKYYETLCRELQALGLDIPVLIGGRLNQIPEGSNSSLPVDVGAQLGKAGAIVCREARELMEHLDVLFGKI